MPANIKIIQAHEFIQATPEGLLDIDSTKKILIQIAATSDSMDESNVILDTRKSKFKLSVSDLYYLAAELSKFHKTFTHKTAVICPQEQFDNTEFFALCAQNRGYNVNAFTALGDALEWLIIEESVHNLKSNAL